MLSEGGCPLAPIVEPIFSYAIRYGLRDELDHLQGNEVMADQPRVAVANNTDRTMVISQDSTTKARFDGFSTCRNIGMT